MKNNIIKKLIALAAAVSMLSCSAVLADESADDDTIDMIVAGSNNMAAELTSLLMNEKQDLFFSPYSIYSALSLLSECAADSEDGTENATRTELLKFLGIDRQLSDIEIAGLQKELISILSENHLKDWSENKETDIPDSSFITSNALLIDSSLNVSPLFPELEELLSYYDAAAEFRKLSSEDTMNYINDWVNKKTKGFISEIISSPLPNSTVAALMNAVYFYGVWDTTFNEEDTDKQIFHGTEKDCEVDMMHMSHNLYYNETDDWQMLTLPYVNGYSMNIFLPKDENTEITWNDPKILNELFSFDFRDAGQYTVTLSMPKFETSWESALDDSLKELGLSSLYDDTDLNRLTEDKTSLSMVCHNARISVTENGTEAAAVTLILEEGALLPAPTENVVMNLNRPFLYTITNNATSLITFVGALNQPQ